MDAKKGTNDINSESPEINTYQTNFISLQLFIILIFQVYRNFPIEAHNIQIIIFHGPTESRNRVVVTPASFSEGPGPQSRYTD
jgi:hypothetical protein